MSETEAKTPKRGIGTVVREALLEGVTNAVALERVKAEFPESSTSLQTISWYRGKLRKEGEKVPTAAEANRAAKPAPAEEAESDPLDE